MRRPKAGSHGALAWAGTLLMSAGACPCLCRRSPRATPAVARESRPGCSGSSRVVTTTATRAAPVSPGRAALQQRRPPQDFQLPAGGPLQVRASLALAALLKIYLAQCALTCPAACPRSPVAQGMLFAGQGQGLMPQVVPGLAFPPGGNGFSAAYAGLGLTLDPGDSQPQGARTRPLPMHGALGGTPPSGGPATRARAGAGAEAGAQASGPPPWQQGGDKCNQDSNTRWPAGGKAGGGGTEQMGDSEEEDEEEEELSGGAPRKKVRRKAGRRAAGRQEGCCFTSVCVF